MRYLGRIEVEGMDHMVHPKASRIHNDIPSCIGIRPKVSGSQLEYKWELESL